MVLIFADIGCLLCSDRLCLINIIAIRLVLDFSMNFLLFLLRMLLITASTLSRVHERNIWTLFDLFHVIFRHLMIAHFFRHPAQFAHENTLIFGGRVRAHFANVGFQVAICRHAFERASPCHVPIGAAVLAGRE